MTQVDEITVIVSEILLRNGMRDVERSSRSIARVLANSAGTPEPNGVASAVDRSLALQTGRSKAEIAQMVIAQLPRHPAKREKETTRLDGVVFVATDLEFEVAAKQLTSKTEGFDQNGNWVLRGQTDGGSHVLLVRTGQGNLASSSVATSVLQELLPPLAVFAGVAGGRHEQAIGDVVIASVVHDFESAEDSGAFGSRAKSASVAHRIQQLSGAVARNESRGRGAVTVRPIASGEKLVTSSNSKTAEWIKVVASDAAVVEMEGLGFMRAASNLEVPSTVVRGVSDHLGDKSSVTDKANQPLAARNATRVALATIDLYRLEKK